MNFMEKFEDKLLPIAAMIGQNKYLVSLRDGMTLAMPLLIVGSFFTLITNLVNHYRLYFLFHQQLLFLLWLYSLFMESG